MWAETNSEKGKSDCKMTREEAIKIIDCYDIGFYDLSGEKIPADKLAEAFDLAIEALSADAVHIETYRELYEKYVNLKHASADAVSRETYHNLVTASNDIDRALREYQDKEENGELVSVVRCKDCRHANECHKSVQYTRNEQNTVTIGYSPIEWCSRGERKES